MAIWDNHSKEMQNQIPKGVKTFAKMLRRDKRKKKIENVLCTRS